MTIHMGPQPMDIGEVDEAEEDYDHEVDAVGYNTVCLRCGGKGHLARNCATVPPPKGKGKNDGKAYGKGSVGTRSHGVDALTRTLNNFPLPFFVRTEPFPSPPSAAAAKQQ